MMQEKTFFLENQQTSQSEIIKWEIPTLGSYVNLEKLIETVPSPQKKIFKIYHPQKDSYIQFTRNNPNISSFHTNPYTISREYLKLNILMIKYTNNPDFPSSDQNSQSEQEDHKKQRSRQRNIRQVIQLVQKWRQFHDNPVDGKKKTLQEAAKLVGVSKKSLDDYYYQLRVGQKHEFDFNAHLQQKIGVLRAFIKNKEPERKVQGKNAKHPKKLKIIQQFTQKLRITDASPVSSPYSHSSFSYIPRNEKLPNVNPLKNLNSPLPSQSIIQLNQDQLFWGAPYTPISQQKFMDCEKNFYNDFDFGLEDIGDPYLPFLPLQDVISKKSQMEEKF